VSDQCPECGKYEDRVCSVCWNEAILAVNEIEPPPLEIVATWTVEVKEKKLPDLDWELGP